MLLPLQILVNLRAGGAASITGTLSATLDGITFAASGSVGHSGTLAATLDGVVPAFTGTTGHTGTLAITLDDAVAALSGTSGHSGTLAIALDGVDVSASATLFHQSEERNSGGFETQAERKRRTPEELKAQRIALGILPAEVAAVANKIAQKAIRKATERQEPDVIDWVSHADQQALYERQMRLEMARRNQVWEAAYAALFDLAVQEALQAEEETILMLMLEL